MSHRKSKKDTLSRRKMGIASHMFIAGASWAVGNTANQMLKFPDPQLSCLLCLDIIKIIADRPEHKQILFDSLAEHQAFIHEITRQYWGEAIKIHGVKSGQSTTDTPKEPSA